MNEVASTGVNFVAARDSCLAMPSAEYAQQFFPEAEIRPGLAKYGSLICSGCSKCRRFCLAMDI